MFAKNFEKWDTILGWSVFFIALIVYTLTVEPTNSFWDAGEYIATSAKLQVGHPPGAPLLQMIGAFFAMFAIEPSKVAYMVNYVSSVSSAFTILFMFWTITNLVRKLIGRSEPLTESKTIAVFGSALVGSLAFTFSDSFWFNAVETEVYSMASFIMALLLWLGLKWTDNLDDPRGNRWVVLISFVVGLTFGIQFMGFLAIPTIGLLFYFKKYKNGNAGSFLIANIVSVAILMLVYKFSLTFVLQLFGWSEVFFVNSIGLPFNSGTIIMGLIIIAVFYFALNFTRKNNYRVANTITLCLMFLMLGFSSWLMLPIRANAKVVINENNPEDARALLAYYNREQYPGVDSPVYGAYYSSIFGTPGDDEDEAPKYEKDENTGKYVIVNYYKNAVQGDDPEHVGLLPRMWSGQHAENYMKYYGRLDFKTKISNERLNEQVALYKNGFDNGEIGAKQYIDFLNSVDEYIEVEPPSLWQNIKYMFDFQFGYMYTRYFMWNFTGRQNDVQGRYNGEGNWLSGIPFIDSMRLGSQENLPTEVLENKGRNTYFFLPFILGLIGLIFQVSKNPKQFWALFVFFMFTGIAIQFYTNPYIFQPRERDYSLVGSFYVFALWIGLGVYGLYDGFKTMIAPKILAPAVTIVCLLAVPSVMAYQNWDDHDRSNRYTANSSAKAYLDSTQKDAGAILFTIGDNDTFPLWYAQEIEGYRTDVRIVCTSLFETDWYIDQMKQKAYTSDPIPSIISHKKYRWGSRDVLYNQNVDPLFNKEISKSRWSIKDFINWVDSDKPTTKIKYIFSQQENIDIDAYSESFLNTVYYPTNKIRIPVNKENALSSGLVKEKDSALIVDYIDIDLPGAITKKSMMMLDIIAQNEWKRPIYFSGGSFDDAEFIWMKDYLQLDGMAYKLVPIRTERDNGFDMGRIDTDLMYDIVKNWQWRNMGSDKIYHDTQTRIQGLSYRSNLARLMEKLIEEEKIEKAKEIIDLTLEKMPVDKFGFYTMVVPFIDGYYKVGEAGKAKELFGKMKKLYQERLSYYAGMSKDEQYQNIDAIISDMEAYRRNIDVLINNSDRQLAEKETLIFNEYIDKFSHFYQNEAEDGEISIPPQDPDMDGPKPPADTIQPDATKVSDDEIIDSLAPETGGN
ncbi:DUF2723 domain-containing protein [Aggregatimonas sangjinii]|uniref:DUF2723 domain-containing protein n=1 Tax=Aggregatimonas sangjinii TaxID=2583587 RepID=A0A5B7SWW2_9FLAO|nr:DUF2723 domain-containing protein [Aggregatimonas sangjinii]QCX01240.1 DUF2723 domain-containing protein [Aggregatimonas sangjinii]